MIRGPHATQLLYGETNLNVMRFFGLAIPKMRCI